MRFNKVYNRIKREAAPPIIGGGSESPERAKLLNMLYQALIDHATNMERSELAEYYAEKEMVKYENQPDDTLTDIVNQLTGGDESDIDPDSNEGISNDRINEF